MTSLQFECNISEILRALGIGRQYLGYNITVKAVRLVLQDENCLFCVKNSIYNPLALQQQCDWRTIERNIRTIVSRAWHVNQPLLIEMAGYHLKREPTVTEFIEMIASYMLRMETIRYSAHHQP
jgi:hypothetical protein